MPDRDRAARHGSPTVRSAHHRICSAPPTAPRRHSLRPLVIPSLHRHPITPPSSLRRLSISPSPLHLPVISVIPPSSLHSLVTSTSSRHLHISPSTVHPLSPLRSPITSAFPRHLPTTSTSPVTSTFPRHPYVPPSPPHPTAPPSSPRRSCLPSSFLRPPRHSGGSRNPSDDHPRRASSDRRARHDPLYGAAQHCLHPCAVRLCAAYQPGGAFKKFDFCSVDNGDQDILQGNSIPSIQGGQRIWPTTIENRGTPLRKE